MRSMATKHVQHVLLLLVVCSIADGNATNAFGVAFLKENAGKPGVVTLPSGNNPRTLVPTTPPPFGAPFSYEEDMRKT